MLQPDGTDLTTFYSLSWMYMYHYYVLQKIFTTTWCAYKVDLGGLIESGKSHWSTCILSLWSSIKQEVVTGLYYFRTSLCCFFSPLSNYVKIWRRKPTLLYYFCEGSLFWNFFGLNLLHLRCSLCKYKTLMLFKSLFTLYSAAITNYNKAITSFWRQPF